MLCLTSSERLHLLERGVVSPGCIYPNPQWRFPVWEVLCGRLVKILLCEGGDVELGARTSKHIFVFAFDPLSLYSLSLSVCIASYYSYHLYAWFDCVPILVLNQESFT